MLPVTMQFIKFDDSILMPLMTSNSKLLRSFELNLAKDFR